VARQLVARAHVNDYAQFHLGRRVAARLRSAQTPDPAVASYGKLAAGTLIPIRARLAVEIAGVLALGWAADDSSGRRPATDYLNGRMGSIAAGTNEMQRNGIGERILGLPREPSFDSNKPFAEVVRAARNWDGRVG
jgi:alkylation response protein AidB-like acyl-CoA dehydrogenase